MARRLLLAAVVAGVLAAPAVAQDAVPAAPPAASLPAGAPGYARRLETGQALVSDFVGSNVYETAAADARSLGEIRNFVVGADGRLAGVVIETSGLDRNRTVAAPGDRIDWSADAGGTPRAIFKAPASELQAAPEFVPQSPADAAANGAAAPGSGAPPATMEKANGYLASLADGQRLSQGLIGREVYSGNGDDATPIGAVNDLVLGKGGGVPLALVGVGGFLGIGEKNVGVPYGALTDRPGGGEPRLVMTASKDQIAAAPAFEAGGRGAAPATGGAPVPNPEAATAPSSVAPTNDLSSMTPLTGTELTAGNLDGVSVYGPNSRGIGKVGDIALTADGRVDAIVVDVGGFLGIGSKPVAVAMENLQFMRDANGAINVYTRFTEDQLRSAPEFRRETYAQNRRTMRLAPSTPPVATDEGVEGSPAPAR